MSTPGDMVIELNFVPAWARRPAKENYYARYEARSAEGRAGREARRRSDDNYRYPKRNARPQPQTSRRAPGLSQLPPRREDSRASASGYATRDKTERSGSEHGQGASDGKYPRGSGSPPAPLKITFIPESRGLKPLAARLRRSGRAYPLLDVAALFISKPNYYAVKHEVAVDGHRRAPLFLYQCSACQAVFLDYDLSVAHALNAHLDRFYAREEIALEPPKGTFTTVARCKLSGELLGPPNYHEFNERLAELHRTRFAAMELEAYRRQIANETDPELIEQWKKEASRQVVYRTLRAAEPATFRRRSQVEAHFREHYAPEFIRRSRRFIASGVTCRNIADPCVRQAVEDSWARENKSALKMASAIQAAFRRLGFHVFKASGKTTFITAILPQAINPAQTTTDVRRILECLGMHPGASRRELVKLLQPQAAPNAPEVAAVLQTLHWLVARGHVIEFYNGTLALPGLPGDLSGEALAKTEALAKPDLSAEASAKAEAKN
ncbi:MAG: hypothetical protein HYV35_00585 [Lentisphaerae bacterium]|nr:hypothetical protein [Lentisphaerota bacterium]